MIIKLHDIKYVTQDRRYFKRTPKGWARTTLKALSVSLGIPEESIKDALQERKEQMEDRQVYYETALEILGHHFNHLRKHPTKDNLASYNYAKQRVFYEADKIGKTQKEVNADIESYINLKIGKKRKSSLVESQIREPL